MASTGSPATFFQSLMVADTPASAGVSATVPPSVSGSVLPVLKSFKLAVRSLS